MELPTITKTQKTKTIMVCCVITFLMASTISCFGQDTKDANCNKINTDGRIFIYQNDFLKEKRMHKMLLERNDSEINRCVRKAKRNKIQQIISMSLGFTLIGVGSGMVITDNLFKDAGISNTAYGYFLGGCAFMVVCDINYSNKHKRNKEAIKLFNQRFNY